MIQPQHQLTAVPAQFPLGDEVDIGKVLRQLYKNLWMISAVAFVGVFIAFICTFTITPLWRTSALIQVKSDAASSSLFAHTPIKTGNASSGIDTQIALLRTRYILEPVVIKNHLNVFILPHYFPMIGAWMARHVQGNVPAPSPLPWFSSYAWGGEKAEILSVSMPDIFEGHSFLLRAGNNGSYQIFEDGNRPILSGKNGVEAISEKYGIRLNVNLSARPGTEFTLVIKSPVTVAGNVARHLSVSAVQGSDPSQSTGVFSLSFTDTDPDRAERVLNAIVGYSIHKNAEQKSADAGKTILFLDKRLPELKLNLQQAENNLNQYHIKNSTLSMSLVSRMLMSQLNTLGQALVVVEARKQGLLQVYTKKHPLVLEVQQKERELREKLKQIYQRIREFPLKNQEEINLMREAKIKNAMYVYLLNSRQQMEVTRAGIATDVVSLAKATPADRQPSHKLLLILVGGLIAGFLASMMVVIRGLLSKTVDTAEQLENESGIPVHAVIPYSKKQKKMEKIERASLRQISGRQLPLILAKREPHEPAIECLRSLKVSLHVMSQVKENQLIALMSSMGGAGKTFISLNLAQVMADSGKRVLLIDGDIRRGGLHKSLHLPRCPGLTEYLAGNCEADDLIHEKEGSFSFISSGMGALRPLELLQDHRLSSLLQKAGQEFERVIIDTAPVLPVTDAVLIAAHCNVKMVVVSAGIDTVEDTKQAVRKIQAHGIGIDAMILNSVKPAVPYGVISKADYVYGNA